MTTHYAALNVKSHIEKDGREIQKIFAYPLSPDHKDQPYLLKNIYLVINQNQVAD